MNKRKGIVSAIIAAAIVLSIAYASMSSANIDTFSNTVRIGYFPNISHSQALVGVANGTFERALEGTNVQYKTFGAGPAAIEALFTNQIDITYVGPNPAINGYIRTDGEGLKVIAGAASGGALFVVRADSGIESPKDLAGKKLVSPQYGNTQDTSLKSYIIKNDLKLAEYGGNVHVLSAKNPDAMILFLKKEIDGAWVPEPWGTILVKDANGKIFLDERDLWPNGEFATTVLVVRSEFLNKHPDLVKKVLQAHVETTLWINEHPEEAKKVVNAQLKALMGKELPLDVIHEAFSRMEITYRPMKFSLFKFAEEAYGLGMLGREKPDLSGIYYTSLLNEVLQEKDLSLVG
jgi:NitT/TauT family transport system substrate-binding protein